MNRFKSDKEHVDKTELQGYSCDVKFTGIYASFLFSSPAYCPSLSSFTYFYDLVAHHALVCRCRHRHLSNECAHSQLEIHCDFAKTSFFFFFLKGAFTHWGLFNRLNLNRGFPDFLDYY